MAVTQIALLRGINVGKAKRIAMADVRAVIESLGGSDVRTLLNSGNAVWSAKKTLTGPALQKAILDATRVDTRTTVLTAADLATIIAEHPLADVVTDNSRFLCYLPAEARDLAKFEPLVDRSWAVEVRIGSRAAYVWSPDGVLAGRLFEHVNKTLGDAFTARNWNTLQKLQQMVTDSAR